MAGIDTFDAPPSPVLRRRGFSSPQRGQPGREPAIFHPKVKKRCFLVISAGGETSIFNVEASTLNIEAPKLNVVATKLNVVATARSLVITKLNIEATAQSLVATKLKVEATARGF